MTIYYTVVDEHMVIAVYLMFFVATLRFHSLDPCRRTKFVLKCLGMDLPTTKFHTLLTYIRQPDPKTFNPLGTDYRRLFRSRQHMCMSTASVVVCKTMPSPCLSLLYVASVLDWRSKQKATLSNSPLFPGGVLCADWRHKELE